MSGERWDSMVSSMTLPASTIPDGSPRKARTSARKDPAETIMSPLTLQAMEDLLFRADDPDTTPQTTVPPCSVIAFNWTAAVRRKKPRGSAGKTIFHRLHFHVRPCSLFAVIGPSGCGKTSMLRYLSMRGSTFAMSGELYLNGANVLAQQPTDLTVSWASQHDNFPPMMTAEEVMMFHAQLRLPEALPLSEKRAKVEELFRTVKLWESRATLVGGLLPGGFSLTGLSGGEQRRLAICVAVVGGSPLLCLDEVTSGLDSSSALNVMRVLKALTRQHGHSIMLTLHQPSPRMWHLVDDVLVLAMGHTIYCGGEAGMMPHFERAFSLSLPLGQSHADFVLDVISSASYSSGIGRSSASFSAKQHAMALRELRLVATRLAAREMRVAAAYAYKWMAVVAAARNRALQPVSTPMLLESLAMQAPDKVAVMLHALSDKLTGHSTHPVHPRHLPRRHDAPGRPASGFLHQCQHLFWHSLRAHVRNPGNVGGRVLMGAIVGLLVGAANAGMDNVVSRSGMLFFIVFAVTLMPFASMSLFITDRSHFLQDCASRLYSPLPYYITYMIWETAVAAISATLFILGTYFLSRLHGSFFKIVILIATTQLIGSQTVQLCASLAPNQDIAFVAGATVSAVSFVFSGFLVRIDDMPYGARWLQWVSYIRYALAGLMCVEIPASTLRVSDFYLLDLLPEGVTLTLGQTANATAATFMSSEASLSDIELDTEAYLQLYNYESPGGGKWWIQQLFLMAISVLLHVASFLALQQTARSQT
eukprot:jgi/Mesvir1/610/Mv02044-RA.1